MKKSPKSKTHQKPNLVTVSLLKKYALPALEEKSDKEARGRILVIAGSNAMPGPAILSATASLRVGAGKLRIATNKSIAPSVAQTMPESYVVSLPEFKSGLLKKESIKILLEQVEDADAILIGPGLDSSKAGEKTTIEIVARLIKATRDKVLVLDACGMNVFKTHPTIAKKSKSQIIITPHAGEMANLTGFSKNYIQENQATVAANFASEHGVTIVLKGRESIISNSENEIFVNKNGNPGLGTSGSGDVLAGLIAGLAARGANPLTACLWGVHLHAAAGDQMAREIGPLGYLARELLQPIPKILGKLQK